MIVILATSVPPARASLKVSWTYLVIISWVSLLSGSQIELNPILSSILVVYYWARFIWIKHLLNRNLISIKCDCSMIFSNKMTKYWMFRHDSHIFCQSTHAPMDTTAQLGLLVTVQMIQVLDWGVQEVMIFIQIVIRDNPQFKGLFTYYYISSTGESD